MNTKKYFFVLIRPLLKARAKNVKNFVGFLGYEKTRLFASARDYTVILDPQRRNFITELMLAICGRVQSRSFYT